MPLKEGIFLDIDIYIYTVKHIQDPFITKGIFLN